MGGIGDFFNTAFGWAFNLFPYSEAKKWLAMYVDPEKTAEAEKTKSSVVDGLKNILITSIPFAIVYAIVQFVWTIIIGALGGNISQGLMNGIIQALLFAVLIPIAGIIFSLLGVAVVWLLAKVLGGKGSYSQHYYNASIVMAGSYLISTILYVPESIPYIGIIFGLIGLLISFYALYVHIVVISKVHGISMGKAAVAIIIPLILLTIIIAIVVAVFFAAALAGMATLGSSGAYGGAY